MNNNKYLCQSMNRIFITMCLPWLFGLLAYCGSTLAEPWQGQRTAFGDPDLQGMWTNATLTSLERDDSMPDKLVVSAEEAQSILENHEWTRQIAEDNKPSDPEAGVFTDGDTSTGYNAFWTDPGTQLLQVRGEYRTSIITEPANGRIPYTPGANAAFFAYAQKLGTDGPEQRPLGERCLVGFGSSGGPPMLPVLYNNHYQIVQSPGYVMIMAEMNHDARIIRLNDEHHRHLDGAWLGDSVGHWDGETLVVHTTNFHPQQSFRFAIKHRLYLPADAEVIERFTRVAVDEIVYQFRIKHPTAYQQAWQGEMTLRQTDERIFEYACHEGNYALPGILAGARREEK